MLDGFGYSGAPRLEPSLKWFEPFHLPKGQGGLILDIARITLKYIILLRCRKKWHGKQGLILNGGMCWSLGPRQPDECDRVKRVGTNLGPRVYEE